MGPFSDVKKTNRTMRSVISFLFCIVVAQLSCSVGAFGPLLATKAVPPPTKGNAKAKVKAEAVAAPKKVAVKKVAVKKAAEKTPVKSKSKSKAKAVAKAKAKADTKAKGKAKGDVKAAALAAKRKKVAEVAKAKAAAFAKSKKAADAKAAKLKKNSVKKTTSTITKKLANSQGDVAIALTKGFKNKNKKTSQPLFPGVQAVTNKRPESALKKKSGDDSEKAKNVVAKKGKSSSDEEAVNPLNFGLQVVQSDKGQEAAAILIEGGLKLVEAILDEGKKTKVVIPRGFDEGTGVLKKPKVTNIGIQQLVDAGIFAGTEFFDVAKSNYEKFYIGGEKKEQVKITRTAAKIDKTGKVIAPVKENYVVKIGGQRVLVNRPLR